MNNERVKSTALLIDLRVRYYFHRLKGEAAIYEKVFDELILERGNEEYEELFEKSYHDMVVRTSQVPF